MPSKKKGEKYKAHIEDGRVKVINSVLYGLVVYDVHIHHEMLSFMHVQKLKRKV